MILSQLLDPILIKLWNLIVDKGKSHQNRQVMENVVEQKEYLKLLISIQVGLFLVDERQIYFTSEQMHALKTQWQSIPNKGAKGYNMKDFQKDLFYLMNENVM